MADRHGADQRSARRRGAETRGLSLFRVCAAMAIPPLLAVATIRIHDGGKLPATGPFILAPNHLSNIDPVVVGATVWRLGRAPQFLAKASLFRIPVIGSVLRAIGQIPVERSGRTQRGAIPLDAAARLIQQGRGVIVYPEGSLTRDPDLWPMRGKTGAARLALQLGLPVVPVAHWGTQDLMPVNTTRFTLRPRPVIDVRFGDPIDLSDLHDSSAATLQAATDRVLDGVTALLEQLRGESAPAARWDPRAHGQSETGRF